MSNAPEPALSNPQLEAPVPGDDHHSAAKDRRSRWLVPGYWLGALLAGSTFGVISTTLKLAFGTTPAISAWIEGFVLSFGGTFIFLLPATMALGVTLWLRTKFLKFAGFARFRVAVVLGIIGGAGVSIPYGFAFARVSDRVQLILFFTVLAWSIVFPVGAGFQLCGRGHVRG